jgi:hypothetical protein
MELLNAVIARTSGRPTFMYLRQNKMVNSGGSTPVEIDAYRKIATDTVTNAMAKVQPIRKEILPRKRLHGIASGALREWSRLHRNL